MQKQIDAEAERSYQESIDKGIPIKEKRMLNIQCNEGIYFIMHLWRNSV
ncbi:hypothetical protein [Neobacillus terrae]|nr:hypothetical protein [Neobacillus terrae]NHM31096.1 hypothetical protein [Neobacillus terrae]